MAVRYFLGLDLGQAHEFTAMAVLERPHVQPRAQVPQRRPAYALRHLLRFPLGTPYAEMFQNVRKLLRTPPLPGTFVVVDQTGVGAAVLGLLKDTLQAQVDCRFCPVTITAGQAMGLGEGPLGVPKIELVSVLQVLLQTRRLQVPRDLPEAGLLVKELENFKTKVTISQAVQTLEAWREGQHDDLVLAVALAAWAGERGLPSLHDAVQDQ